MKTTKEEMQYPVNIIAKRMFLLMNSLLIYKKVSVSYDNSYSEGATPHVFGYLKTGGYVSIFPDSATKTEFSYNSGARDINYSKNVKSVEEVLKLIRNPTALAKSDTKKDELIGAVVVAVNRNDTRGLEITLKTTNGKKFVMNQH